MPELIAKSPAKGSLPREIGGLTLDEAPETRITGLSPFAGQEKAVGAVLSRALGLDLPGTNGMAHNGDAAILWTGRNRWMLLGPEPDAGLESLAATTDQSDAWVVVDLTGPAGPDVLARLVPVDLRAGAFQVDMSIRTELYHMQAIIARPAPDVIRILCFRSMARTLVHDLTQAAEAVAARAKL